MLLITGKNMARNRSGEWLLGECRELFGEWGKMERTPLNRALVGAFCS